jgi:hypothetical protein
MSKTVYLLFVHTDDATLCSGVYDSEEKCEEAIAKINKDLGEDLEDDQIEIVETEIDELITYPVVEFGDEEDEE